MVGKEGSWLKKIALPGLMRNADRAFWGKLLGTIENQELLIL